MTIKVTYNVTDIYVSESVSATYINVSYEAPSGGGGAVWGDIIGTLSDQADLQAALDAKVPYSGATANVDLGEYELKAGQIEFDQTPTGVAGVAVTRWNDSTGTIETTLKGGSVVLEHGRDMFERVVNKTGIQLTKAAYQAVRVSNAQGQRLAVQLAQANNDNNSADTIGLVVETIDNNQEGYIYTVGEIDGVNTTGTLQGETWVDGDVLYLSPTTAGRITNVKPVAPQHLVVIGYVVYAHANNGKIYVKVMNGWELGELHDVDTTGAVAGNVLKYNGTIWTPSGDVGITSLNSLNAVSQTFATGTSGTDFNISSATSTHTFNLPSASAVNRGLLTSADWTTFNNKQNALTNPITGTGVSGQVSYWSGTNTQTGSNNLFWDATNNRLGIRTNAPVYELDLFSIGTNNITFGMRHAVNTASQIFMRDTTGAGNFIINSGSSYSYGTLGNNSLNLIGYGNVTLRTSNTAPIRFATTNADPFFSTVQLQMFPATGNVRLQNGGTYTDSGQRLQVEGDTLLKGSGNTSATTALTVQNSDSGNILRLRNDGVFVIGNHASQNTLIFPFSTTAGVVDLSARNLQFYNQSTSSVPTNGAFLFSGVTFSPTSSTALFVNISNTFAPTSGTGVFTLLNIAPTINQTGGANGITRGLYVNPTLTAAADWRSIEWSNNTGWGLYGAGTSNNYLAGSLGIGSTSLTGVNLSITKSITGSLISSSVIADGVINSDVTTTAFIFRTRPSTQAASFGLGNLTHYSASINTIGAGSFITRQIGFSAGSDLIGATENFGFFGNIASGTGRWNVYMQGTALNYMNGALLLGSTTSSGEQLQVTGTMKVTGASTFGGNMALTLNQNAATLFTLNNGTAGTSSQGAFQINSNSGGNASFGKVSTAFTAYKITSASDAYIYNGTNGDISILNDFSSGSIKMAAGGSSTAQWTIGSNGDLTAADGENIIFGTTNGTKLGTATSQKIGFWNATPIVQPTTAVAAAAFVANTGTAVNDASTFDGYTMRQVVKALRNAGLLA